MWFPVESLLEVSGHTVQRVLIYCAHTEYFFKSPKTPHLGKRFDVPMNIAAAVAGVALDGIRLQRRAECRMFSLKEIITKLMSTRNYDQEGRKPAETVEETKTFRPSSPEIFWETWD